MLLLLCASTRPLLVWAFVAIHIVATPLAISAFGQLHDKRFGKTRRALVEEFADATRPHITYDPTLPPWGNTVLVNANQYQVPLLGLPRGVGASAVVYWNNVTLPLRSRYVLLTPQELESLSTRVRLRKLADTRIGQLFENLDWRR